MINFLYVGLSKLNISTQDTFKIVVSGGASVKRSVINQPKNPPNKASELIIFRVSLGDDGLWMVVFSNHLNQVEIDLCNERLGSVTKSNNRYYLGSNSQDGLSVRTQ